MNSPGARSASRRRGAAIIQDRQECIPLTSKLGEGDLLYLLTPAVVPIELPAPGSPAQDPFEPLGRALAEYHPWVRHIPYVARDGITQYHANHLALAKAVIFVITGAPFAGQPSQVGLLQAAWSFAPNIPHIVIVCCSLGELGPSNGFFPTLIEAQDYSVDCLECAADLLFLPLESQRPPPMSLIDGPRQRWLVEEWRLMEHLPATHDLWIKCRPERFWLPMPALRGLLDRAGYGKHYVVVDPVTRELLGFCATYTTYISATPELDGCIAVILVHPSHRGRGIGTALHNHSLRKLTEPNKVIRLQLGNTFPRLLYGPIPGHDDEDWFRRRGWCLEPSTSPAGRAQEANDWLLDFSDWRASGLSDEGLVFERGVPEDAYKVRVLDFVVAESDSEEKSGWYDQYLKAFECHEGGDVLVVSEDNRIVATALVFVPREGGRMAQDIPWARTISETVGGLACISISAKNLSPLRTRDSVIIRLINYCVESLAERGMDKMFLDAVHGGDEGFLAIGFHKWATYKRVSRAH